MMSGYYVTLRRDASQTAWLAGPYRTYAAASAAVPHATAAALEIDPFTHFDAHGVTKLTRPYLPPGRINGRLPVGFQPHE